MRLAAHGSVRRRRAVGIAVVAALLGGATACGTEAEEAAGTKPNATPAEAVARAALRTADITSLRYRVTGTLPEEGKVRAEASMEVKPSVMGMELTGLGDGEDKPVKIRFVDGAMYTEGDTTVLGDTDGKRWIKAEPASWGGLSVDNRSYGVLPRQLEGSPLVQSTILVGAKDVEEVGTESVEGAATIHYRGTVTNQGLKDAQSAAKGKETWELRTHSRDQFMSLRLRVGSALAMDLWVDEDGRAKQFRLRGRTSALDGDGRWADTGPLDLTYTFLDVGRPVTVDTPAAEDTVDLGELVDGAGAG
ncbi:hypothetical protein OG920_27400 [Streptomyces europaeiscabiei]|uniref:hypothetical protein n=1 Tax=Streptomyces europaeiscabiei TaxID=146819 RepID=UPI0029B5F79B|nr:hypothetical protein [Streptomyces europaeiscabiei]MDX3587040.1 hypothetical protein [Streptomyces europaeiscabiei]MDX3613447.1 hypothetical protein [Streptomyces europaeiscabiei]